MLSESKIKAMELIIEDVEKLIAKKLKVVEREKAKRDNSYVTYKGDKYSSIRELQEAYECDAFSSATFDRLLEKLDKAKGTADVDSYTPTESIVIEMQMIINEFKNEILQNNLQIERQNQKDERIKELVNQGHSLKEAETILGNEELMRFE